MQAIEPPAFGLGFDATRLQGSAICTVSRLGKRPSKIT